MKYRVRYVHKIAPSPGDHAEAELDPNALHGKLSAGKALRDAGVLLRGARVRQIRVENGSIVVFPSMPGLSTYWHSIILTPAG